VLVDVSRVMYYQLILPSVGLRVHRTNFSDEVKIPTQKSQTFAQLLQIYTRGSPIRTMVDLVDRLFAYVKLDRKAVKGGKAQVSKLLDGLISGIGVKLTQDEKKLPPGLAQIVNTISAERASTYSFVPFPEHELLETFVLTAPRKVNTYAAGNKTIAQQAAAAGGPPKEKVKREPTGAAARGNPNWRVGFGRSKISRAQAQEDMGHFVSEDQSFNDDDTNPRKRERVTDDGNMLSDLGAPEQILSSSEIILPLNFFAVISGVFETFWQLEFDNPQVSQAFFAKIDLANCRSYGLESFAESSMSLSVIRDRLEATKATAGYTHSSPYISPEDFYSDFRQMFENIFAFFPPQSAPQLKAVELNTMFHSKWEGAKTAFKYK